MCPDKIKRITWIIQEAKQEIVPALALLQIKCWATTYRNILPVDYLNSFSLEHTERYWLKELKEKNKKILVATIGGNVVGYVDFTLGHSKTTNRSFVSLGSLYIHPKEKRKGIGSSLLNHVESLSKVSRFSISLFVHYENHSAKSFFEKNGYTAIRICEKFSLGASLNVKVTEYFKEF